MVNVLLFVTAVLVWGTTWIAITFQLGVVPIEWSLVYRFGLAAALFFAYALVRGNSLRFSKAQHTAFLGLGLFTFSSNYYLSYVAVGHVQSGLVAVMFSTLTIMNIVNAIIFLKRPFEPRILFAALAGLAGITLIFWREVDSLSLSDSTMLGLSLAFLAAVLASFGATVAASDRIKVLRLTEVNAWSMLYGTAFLIVGAILAGKPPAWEGSLSYGLSLGYLVVGGTVVAFMCYLALIVRIGPERAGYTAIAFPVVAIIVSTLFEGYVWSLTTALGLILVLGGNLIILRSPRVRAKAPLPIVSD